MPRKKPRNANRHGAGGRRLKASRLEAKPTAKQLRALRKKFSPLPRPKPLQDVEALVATPAPFSRGDMLDFLSRNRAFAARAISEEAMQTGDLPNSVVKGVRIGAKDPDFIFELLKDPRTPYNELMGITDRTIRIILDDQVRHVGPKTDAQIKRYFKARGIQVNRPINREAIPLATKRLFKTSPPKRPELRIDMALLDQIFFRTRKKLRQKDHAEAEAINFYFQAAFSRERMTPNQRKAAKKWLSGHFLELVARYRAEIGKVLGERMKDFRGATEAEFFEKASRDEIKKVMLKCTEADAWFVERARQEVLHRFKEKPKTTRVEKRPAVGYKLGSRAERINAHEAREKPASERQKELKKMGRQASRTGQSFDEFAYAMNEIAQENPESERFLRQLVNKGKLKRESVVRLFIRGAQAQRYFMYTLQRTPFERTFGPKAMDALARFLVGVGAQGRQVEKAKKVLQSQKEAGIYDFLLKHKIVELHGPGGVVLYLGRNLQ